MLSLGSLARCNTPLWSLRSSVPKEKKRARKAANRATPNAISPLTTYSFSRLSHCPSKPHPPSYIHAHHSKKTVSTSTYSKGSITAHSLNDIERHTRLKTLLCPILFEPLPAATQCRVNAIEYGSTCMGLGLPIHRINEYVSYPIIWQYVRGNVWKNNHN